MLLCYISFIISLYMLYFIHIQNENIIVNKSILLRPLCCRFVDLYQKLLYVDICLNSLPWLLADRVNNVWLINW